MNYNQRLVWSTRPVVREFPSSALSFVLMLGIAGEPWLASGIVPQASGLKLPLSELSIVLMLGIAGES